MMENFVVFDSSPYDDLNVLFDTDMNGLYYYKCVATNLASLASL